MRCWLSIFVICAYATALCRAASTTQSSIRELLVDGYRFASSATKDIRVVYQYRNTADIEWFKKYDAAPAKETIAVSEYIQKNGKERIGAVVPEGTIGGFAVFDGQRMLSYWPTAGTTDTETQRGRAMLLAQTTGIFDGGEGPCRLFGYKPGCMPSDILTNDNCVISETPLRVGDLLAYAVSAPVEINKVTYRVSYLLSPERTGLPLRMEFYEPTGELGKVMEFTAFTELQAGRWFPTKVTLTEYVTESGKRRAITTHTYTVEQVESNPDVDEERAFKTAPDALPFGARLHDEISGLEYVIGEGPISDERIQYIVNQTMASIDSVTPNAVPNSEADHLGLNSQPRPLFSPNGIHAPQSDISTEHTVGASRILFFVACGIVLFFLLIWLVRSRISVASPRANHD